MKKYPLQTERIGPTTVRYTLKLEADPMPTRGTALTQFFRDLTDQPLLLKCGPSLPEKITISFNGDIWILTGTVEEQIDMTNVMFEESEGGQPAKLINPFEGKY